MPPEDRLARLRQARLRTLLRDAWGVELPEAPTPASGGAPSVVVEGERAVVAVDELGRTRLSAPLFVARDPAIRRLDVVVAEDPDGLAGVLARQLGLFDLQGGVQVLDGATLATVTPSPRPPHAAPPEGIETLVAVLEAAGVEVVVEGGVVRGEVRGLEVARIVGGPEEVRLEVGVGSFDRSITSMLHADLPTADALARAAVEVGRHRRPGAPPHPVRDLRPERWVRADLVADPRRVGASSLRPASSVLASERLRDLDVAMAEGLDDAGRPVVVAVVRGTDVDGPARAADSAEWHDPAARVVLASVGPMLGPIRDLAARLEARPEVVELPPPWT